MNYICKTKRPTDLGNRLRVTNRSLVGASWGSSLAAVWGVLNAVASRAVEREL